MRTPSIATVRYAPGVVPTRPDDLPRYLTNELTGISAAISALATGQLDMSYAAPDKPRDGMVRLADGVQWNPGAGAGVYCYYHATWNRLG